MEAHSKIVIVDDNDMFLETLKSFVENINKNFECVTFSDPEDALKYVANEKIYAVISDFEMPKMNGLTLAKKIMEVLPETKIIVMSGHDSNYLRKQALEAGIDENKIKLLCKSDIISLRMLLNN